MLVFSSMMPIGVGDAYYLNWDESVNYPQWNDITFYDVAWNEREVMSYNLWATSTDIEDEDSENEEESLEITDDEVDLDDDNDMDDLTIVDENEEEEI